MGSTASGDGQVFFGDSDHRESPHHDFHASTFGRRKSLIVQVGLVDNTGQVPEGRVRTIEAVEHGLEAAVATVVGKLHSPHVEAGGIVRDLVGIVDEQELGLRVYKPADQPGASGAVHMAVLGGCPLHASTSMLAASRATARRARSRSDGG